MALLSVHVARPAWLMLRCCNLCHRDEINSLKHCVTALAQYWHKDENRLWFWGHAAFFAAVSPFPVAAWLQHKDSSGLVRGRERRGHQIRVAHRVWKAV